MSLNKTRKRLIRKCRKHSRSKIVGIRIKLGSRYWTFMGKTVESYIPDASFIKAGNLDASKLSLSTIHQRIKKELVQKKVDDW